MIHKICGNGSVFNWWVVNWSWDQNRCICPSDRNTTFITCVFSVWLLGNVTLNIALHQIIQWLVIFVCFESIQVCIKWNLPHCMGCWYGTFRFKTQYVFQCQYVLYRVLHYIPPSLINISKHQQLGERDTCQLSAGWDGMIDFCLFLTLFSWS